MIKLQATLSSLLEEPNLASSCSVKQVEFNCGDYFCFGTATKPNTFLHSQMIFCVHSSMYVYVTTQLERSKYQHPHRIGYY